MKDQDINVRFEALPEHISVEGNAMASGDPKVDKEAEQNIISQLEDGNQYAWFTAKVVAEWQGIESEPEYLGACSYTSREDFIENSGYYDDMVASAKADLIQKVKALKSKIDTLDLEDQPDQEGIDSDLLDKHDYIDRVMNVQFKDRVGTVKPKEIRKALENAFQTGQLNGMARERKSPVHVMIIVDGGIAQGAKVSRPNVKIDVVDYDNQADDPVLATKLEPEIIIDRPFSAVIKEALEEGE